MSLQIHLEPKIALLRRRREVSISCFEVSHLSKIDIVLRIAFADLFVLFFPY